jgi:Flp pilus assembly protein TadG
MNNKKGVATLPMVLLVGGLLVEIGIVGAFMAYFLAQSGFGEKLSEEALTAARSGIQDAEMKIVRNPTDAAAEYDLSVGNYSTHVIICNSSKTVCDTVSAGKYEITSLGSALTKRRKIRAIIDINQSAGEAQIESEKEITVQ